MVYLSIRFGRSFDKPSATAFAMMFILLLLALYILSAVPANELAIMQNEMANAVNSDFVIRISCYRSTLKKLEEL